MKILIILPFLFSLSVVFAQTNPGDSTRESPPNTQETINFLKLKAELNELTIKYKELLSGYLEMQQLIQLHTENNKNALNLLDKKNIDQLSLFKEQIDSINNQVSIELEELKSTNILLNYNFEDRSQKSLTKANNLDISLNDLKEVLITKVETLNQQTAILNNDINQNMSHYKLFKKESNLKLNEIEKNIQSHSTSYDLKLNSNLKLINNNEIYYSNGIRGLTEKLSQSKLYWILSFIIISIVIVLVLWFSKKILFTKIHVLDKNINDFKETLNTGVVNVDNKLVAIIETQLELTKQTSSQDDHSLALKVADEIIRIQKNLGQMDEKAKGLKQLTASVIRIQDNFASNGYEIVDMLGQTYSEGMNASVNYVPDDELDEGVQIITRIIKPQVNYNNVMIQPAQIEVSQGE